MPARDEPWPEGTPSWVDLTTPDREAAWSFYSSLFGWDVEDQGPDAGHYGMARLHGRDVAGIGQPPPGPSAPPPAWTTYLAVRDVEASAAAVTEHGGTVAVPPVDVGTHGRMALAVDPTGAVFGMWQAGDVIGASLVNEPGALVWTELLTPDAATARDFYAKVFGYTYTALPGELDYTTIDGAGPGNTVGGIGVLDGDRAGDVPPHWNAYFEVADADSTAARAVEDGGAVLAGPLDSPFGRIAVIRDPQGATFSIIQAGGTAQGGDAPAVQPS